MTVSYVHIWQIEYWSTRPITVPAGSDHYFHTECPSVRPSVRPSQNFKFKRQSLLAEWIIDYMILLLLRWNNCFSVLGMPLSCSSSQKKSQDRVMLAWKDHISKSPNLPEPITLEMNLLHLTFTSPREDKTLIIKDMSNPISSLHIIFINKKIWLECILSTIPTFFLLAY